MRDRAAEMLAGRIVWMRREDLAAIATIMSRLKRVDVPRPSSGSAHGSASGTPGQAEFARVAYDGLEPWIETSRSNLRSGSAGGGAVVWWQPCADDAQEKSYVMVALRLVHGMLVRDDAARYHRASRR